MAAKIVVENLPSDITEERLKDIFTQIGEVESVTLRTELLKKQSKSGLVEMSLDIDAYRAVNCFDGATIKDRRIGVRETRPLLERARTIFSRGIHGINIHGLSLFQNDKSH